MCHTLLLLRPNNPHPRRRRNRPCRRVGLWRGRAFVWSPKTFRRIFDTRKDCRLQREFSCAIVAPFRERNLI